MSELDRTAKAISYIFFGSQLLAISVYAGASAIVMFRAGDMRNGLTIALLVVGMIAAVLGFRLPNYFASRFSSSTISFIAVAFSLIVLLPAIAEARSYLDLPEPLLANSGVSQLRMTANLGVIFQILTFIVNLVAAFIVPWIARKDSSVRPGT